MSEVIVKNVNEKLQKDKEFTLQLDESTDVSVFEFHLKHCFRTIFGFIVKFNLQNVFCVLIFLRGAHFIQKI